MEGLGRLSGYEEACLGLGCGGKVSDPKLYNLNPSRIGVCICRVAVQELVGSYYSKKTLVFAVYSYYGNLSLRSLTASQSTFVFWDCITPVD